LPAMQFREPDAPGPATRADRIDGSIQRDERLGKIAKIGRDATLAHTSNYILAASLQQISSHRSHVPYLLR
jgi:hypothetical protein